MSELASVLVAYRDLLLGTLQAPLAGVPPEQLVSLRHVLLSTLVATAVFGLLAAVALTAGCLLARRPEPPGGAGGDQRAPGI